MFLFLSPLPFYLPSEMEGIKISVLYFFVSTNKTFYVFGGLALADL